MASQEGTGSAGTADTSVHNIQEPPRCPPSRLNRTYPRGKPKWPYWITKNSLPPRPARTFGPWSLNKLQRLVKAFHDWEKVNFTQMVTGHNNGLLDYLEHKDSIAHLQDFLDVVLPNLHQHYICRSTDCSFVIKASHWINSATPDKQGKYLCPRCRTEYRPWAAAAVNQSKQEVLPSSTMPCDQGHLSHTSRQRWLGTTASQITPHPQIRFICI